MSATALDLQDNNSTTNPYNFREVFLIVLITAVATGLQALWTNHFISSTVGLVNVLPTFLFLTLWLTFSKFSQQNWRSQWLVFSLGFMLTLRLPITVHPSFQVLSWLLYGLMVLAIVRSVANYFRATKFRATILLITTCIIIFVAFSHIGLNSPFTSAFRLINGQSSSFVIGADNNQTWECAYEYQEMPVHCDMRHLIASEKIFTEKGYDPSFSVFLRRFFYGYLSSLVGYPGERWIASFSLNILIWLLGCMAIYRLCELLNFEEAIAGISSLSMAASWGFVSFVAQPAPYMTAYALSAILPWAVFELIQNSSRNVYRDTFGVTVILTGLTIYDIYPITLTCLVMLCFNQRTKLALLLVPMQIAILLVWQKVSLGMILGTTGNPRNSQVIFNSLTGWWQAISDVSLTMLYTTKGIESFLIAGFGIGAIAPFVWLGLAKTPRAANQGNAVVYMAIFTGLMLLTALFFTPEAFYWSPSTGMLPRFVFYTFVVNTIALGSLGDRWLGKWAYILPVLTLAFACLDFTGIASMTLMFDYGGLRLVWK